MCFYIEVYNSAVLRKYVCSMRASWAGLSALRIVPCFPGTFAGEIVVCNRHSLHAMPGAYLLRGAGLYNRLNVEPNLFGGHAEPLWGHTMPHTAAVGASCHALCYLVTLCRVFCCLRSFDSPSTSLDGLVLDQRLNKHRANFTVHTPYPHCRAGHNEKLLRPRCNPPNTQQVRTVVRPRTRHIYMPLRPFLPYVFSRVTHMHTYPECGMFTCCAVRRRQPRLFTDPPCSFAVCMHACIHTPHTPLFYNTHTCRLI